MTKIDDALRLRFGDETPAVPEVVAACPNAQLLAARRSQRAFKSDPVDPQLVRSLCALALCSPTKSDLQQRDIIIVEDPAVRSELNALIPGNAWLAAAPVFLVFCANNRRQRLIHEWRGKPFANDHLDAFFNASLDAGIALSAFITAAEAVGLGCCPVSAIRNEPAAVSELLNLPDHVFAVAGLALGWPLEEGVLSPRLPLDVTVHTDSYTEAGLEQKISDYDRRRAAVLPYGRQREVERFGKAEFYGWSEDKARQYSRSERADFGAFVRAKGFDLS
ncbi:MAG: oxygen-insensitive NADPH nitroreductase [Methyloligellaceae bacterium]